MKNISWASWLSDFFIRLWTSLWTILPSGSISFRQTRVFSRTLWKPRPMLCIKPSSLRDESDWAYYIDYEIKFLLAFNNNNLDGYIFHETSLNKPIYQFKAESKNATILARLINEYGGIVADLYSTAANLSYYILVFASHLKGYGFQILTKHKINTGRSCYITGLSCSQITDDTYHCLYSGSESSWRSMTATKY